MTGALLLLVTCYALLALLVLAMCLYSRWPAWLKTASIVAFTGLAVLTYDALAGMLGYATPGALPPRFVFHGAVIGEPNRADGDKGTIYVWATELARDGLARSPRAYEIPFDKPTAAMLTEAQKRTRQGIVQLGQALEPETSAASGPVMRLMPSSRPQTIRLFDKPEPALPEK